jgi:hypothetical protein
MDFETTLRRHPAYMSHTLLDVCTAADMMTEQQLESAPATLHDLIVYVAAVQYRTDHPDYEGGAWVVFGDDVDLLQYDCMDYRLDEGADPHSPAVMQRNRDHVESLVCVTADDWS